MTTKEKAVNDYIKEKHNQDECIGFIDGYTKCQEDMVEEYTEEDVLKYAWFLVENIGQYICDKTANFEGKYLEEFKNKQD